MPAAAVAAAVAVAAVVVGVLTLPDDAVVRVHGSLVDTCPFQVVRVLCLGIGSVHGGLCRRHRHGMPHHLFHVHTGTRVLMSSLDSGPIHICSKQQAASSKQQFASDTAAVSVAAPGVVIWRSARSGSEKSKRTRKKTSTQYLVLWGHVAS